MKFTTDQNSKKTTLKTPFPKFQEGEYLNASSRRFDTGNEMLNSALHYASLGCPVFPVHSIITNRDGKRICTCRSWETCDKQGKHPRTWHGLNDATTDAETLRKLWKKFPNSNVGLLTGRRAGLFVLDIDNKYGGEYSLVYLQENYQEQLGKNFTPLPATLIANTGSGGRHIFFKYPDDILISGSISEIGASLDVRAESNYVVTAPSSHVSGRAYSWHGVNTPILEAPDWLIYEIISGVEIKEMSSEAPVSNSSDSRKIRDGEGRHDYLWKYICGLIGSHSKEQVLAFALNKNKEIIEPPKSRNYIEYQVNYLYAKYSNRNDLGVKE